MSVKDFLWMAFIGLLAIPLAPLLLALMFLMMIGVMTTWVVHETTGIDLDMRFYNR